ncbi:MAG: hypothetical protein SFU99_16685 [Saprospiraceae bacterium]|nr:hypothetical protein [Saprospiraceae bacterium]
MKAFQKILALALLLVSASTVFAAETIPTVRIEKSGSEKKVSVIVEQITSAVTVEIATKNGFVLETKTSEGDKFAKIFNVESLEEGNYQVIVYAGTREIIQPFSIKNDQILLNAAERQTYFVPTMTWKNDALDLMMFNTRLADVNFRLTDELGNTIFEDSMKNVLKVERRYNLDELASGKYVVEVLTPHKTYYKDIVVQ